MTLSAGQISRCQNAPIPETVNANQWDNIQEYAWKQHRIILFHSKDGRISKTLRALGEKYMSWKWGRK